MKEDYKVNYILTIQHEKENPKIIEKYTKDIGDIYWHNLTLTGANMAIFMNKNIQKMIIDNIIFIFNCM